MKTENKSDLYLVFTVLVRIALDTFLWPAVFMWIWNWQLSDVYVFNYSQVFWLNLALGFLLAEFGDIE